METQNLVGTAFQQYKIVMRSIYMITRTILFCNPQIVVLTFDISLSVTTVQPLKYRISIIGMLFSNFIQILQYIRHFTTLLTNFKSFWQYYHIF